MLKAYEYSVTVGGSDITAQKKVVPVQSRKRWSECSEVSSTSMSKGDHTCTAMEYVNGKMHWGSAVLIILISKLQLYLHLEIAFGDYTYTQTTSFAALYASVWTAVLCNLLDCLHKWDQMLLCHCWMFHPPAVGETKYIHISHKTSILWCEHWSPSYHNRAVLQDVQETATWNHFHCYHGRSLL